jgi:hypothetical protein
LFCLFFPLFLSVVWSEGCDLDESSKFTESVRKGNGFLKSHDGLHLGLISRETSISLLLLHYFNSELGFMQTNSSLQFLLLYSS